MSYGAALAALTTAPKAAPMVDITLPEGPSRREEAPSSRRRACRAATSRPAKRSAKLDPRDYGAPSATQCLEGFLFPDTYQLRSRRRRPSGSSTGSSTRSSTSSARSTCKRARRKHLSRYDVLIIASMIEREALGPADRRLISAVIYNRLQQGIPLGIDATLRYA